MADNEGPAVTVQQAIPTLLQCEICNDDYQQLKRLSCDHSFCLPCIEKWVANSGVVAADSNSGVSCPKCRQTTVLNGPADTLQTKFAGQLRCFQCSTMKELDDTWWCKDCVSTICSKCAMIRHKDHEVELFEKYGVLSLCDFIFREETAEEQAKLSRLQLCLKYYLQGVIDELIAAARLRKVQRRNNWRQMQLLMRVYGFASSTYHMSKCDANQLRIHLSKSKVHNIVQQVSELACLRLNDFHPEDSEGDLAEWFVTNLKSRVLSLTATQLREVGTYVDTMKGSIRKSLLGENGGELNVVSKPQWQEGAIRSPQMKRPLDVCMLPGKELVVADCESGILVFDNTGKMFKTISCIQGSSLCYDVFHERLIIAIQRDQRAMYFSSKFEYLCENPIPQGDPWFQLRCSANGMMFCVTSDSWTNCLHLHYFKDNEWKTIAHVPDAASQFFSLATALPIRGINKPNLCKLLLVSDSGALYEIMVERCQSEVFKHVRHVQIDDMVLEKPTAIAVAENEDIFIYDSGMIHIISPEYRYKKSLNLMDEKLMVTAIIPTATMVYINAINDMCIAALSLE